MRMLVFVLAITPTAPAAGLPLVTTVPACEPWCSTTCEALQDEMEDSCWEQWGGARQWETDGSCLVDSGGCPISATGSCDGNGNIPNFNFPIKAFQPGGF